MEEGKRNELLDRKHRECRIHRSFPAVNGSLLLVPGTWRPLRNMGRTNEEQMNVTQHFSH